MRIVASLGVKDEAEIIQRTIAHLRAIGVDHVVACDMYSADGTLEILESEARRGDLTVFQMSDQESQDEWSRRNLEAVRHTGADWVIFADADEYPVPAAGHLRECAALADADVLIVDRFNTVVGAAGPCLPAEIAPGRYDDLLLIVQFIPNFWRHLRGDPAASWMRKQLAPRAMARVDVIEGLPLGVHDVVSPRGTEVRRVRPDDLVVAHLPFSTRERFARKVENIRVLLSAHDELFGERYGLHWRRWLELADRGELGEEFDRMVFNGRTIERLRGQGVIRSAAEIFTERLQSSVA